MAYVFGFCDGFDHYAPADAGRKYRSVTGSFSSVPGPHHGNGVRFEGGGNYLDFATGGAVTSRSASLWLYLHASTWGATEHVCPVQLMFGSTPPFTVKQSLWVHSDGSVSVRRGTAGDTVVAASAAGVFAFDTWVYLDYSSALATSATGRCDVFLDGVAVVTATGVQTCTGTPRTANHERIGNCLSDGNAVRLDVDDFASAHNSSNSTPETAPPAFVGPHAIATLYPVGPGDSAGFTPAGAAANWECCAEQEGDGDTTYVTKTAGSDPLDLYRVAPFNTPTPALPVDSDDPDYDQYQGTLWALLRDAGGSTSRGNVASRFRDADGTLQTWDQRWLLTADYAYYANAVDVTRPALQTLQAGWGGGTASGHTDDVFRGSQLAVELWYPVGAPAAPPAGGTRWSVSFTP